jgi:hypothetical protein
MRANENVKIKQTDGIAGEIVQRPSWGKDQPNNYNGEQNCVVLDGGRGWLWNDVGCNLDYLHWICQSSEYDSGVAASAEKNPVLELKGEGRRERKRGRRGESSVASLRNSVRLKFT